MSPRCGEASPYDSTAIRSETFASQPNAGRAQWSVGSIAEDGTLYT